MHHPFNFEKRKQALAPRRMFYRRLGSNLLLALAMIGVSLAAGMAGYMYFESLGPADAFINAAMIISGMGPVDQMKTTAGKVFAGSFALYSGVLIIALAGVILAPLGHRILHRFHAVDEEKKGR